MRSVGSGWRAHLGDQFHDSFIDDFVAIEITNLGTSIAVEADPGLAISSWMCFLTLKGWVSQVGFGLRFELIECVDGLVGDKQESRLG